MAEKDSRIDTTLNGTFDIPVLDANIHHVSVGRSENDLLRKEIESLNREVTSHKARVHWLEDKLRETLRQLWKLQDPEIEGSDI